MEFQKSRYIASKGLTSLGALSSASILCVISSMSHQLRGENMKKVLVCLSVHSSSRRRIFSIADWLCRPNYSTKPFHFRITERPHRISWSGVEMLLMGALRRSNATTGTTVRHQGPSNPLDLDPFPPHRTIWLGCPI